MTLAEWFGAHGETSQYAVYFGLLGVLVVAERIKPFRPRTGPRGQSWATNYALTLLNVLAIGALPISFVAIAELAHEQGVGLLSGLELGLPVSVALSLLLRSFISFITHLLMHKVPLLWRVHRVHHLDTDIDVSTTVRFHPLEFPLGLIIGAPLVFAFGLSPWVLILYELLDVAVTLWSHSNLATPRWVESLLRYAVVTPALHRVHHSIVPDETDSNFGAVFPLWDLAFGTFRARTRAEPSTMPIGLMAVRDGRARNLWWLLSVPFRRLDLAQSPVAPAALVLEPRTP
jgi:sterol desaturase/sphingolipid hydroxylase (fatty acid hydroxylase superfamily)